MGAPALRFTALGYLTLGMQHLHIAGGTGIDVATIGSTYAGLDGASVLKSYIVVHAGTENSAQVTPAPNPELPQGASPSCTA